MKANLQRSGSYDMIPNSPTTDNPKMSPYHVDRYNRTYWIAKGATPALPMLASSSSHKGNHSLSTPENLLKAQVFSSDQVHKLQSLLRESQVRPASSSNRIESLAVSQLLILDVNVDLQLDAKGTKIPSDDKSMKKMIDVGKSYGNSNPTFEIKSATKYEGRAIVKLELENGESVFFYKSSKGTSGKKKDEWYPFPGIIKSEMAFLNNWFMKNDDISNFYGVPAFRNISDQLTKLEDSRQIDVSKF